MKLTKQCYGCKEQFRREELVDYAAPGAKHLQSYCPNCLKEKQAKDRFADKIRQLFGVNPGPKIWTQRKNIINTYGYTDDTIIDCLEYVYNVEKKIKKTTDTLFFVNPTNVDKAKKWKKSEEYQAMMVAKAAGASQDMKEYLVPVQKSKINNKQLLNADDFLEN